MFVFYFQLFTHRTCNQTKNILVSLSLRSFSVFTNGFHATRAEQIDTHKRNWVGEVKKTTEKKLCVVSLVERTCCHTIEKVCDDKYERTTSSFRIYSGYEKRLNRAKNNRTLSNHLCVYAWLAPPHARTAIQLHWIHANSTCSPTLMHMRFWNHIIL